MNEPKIINVENNKIPVILTTTGTKHTQIFATQGLVQIKKNKHEKRTLRRIIEDHKDVVLHEYLLMTKKAVLDRSEEEYKEICNNYIDQFSKELNVTPTRVAHRPILIDTFGTTRKNGVVTLNYYMRYMEEELIKYCIYHELCHLYTWKNYNTMYHDKDFYDVLYRRYTYDEIKELTKVK
ncbi:MAG: M48 family metallopeptidase [Methanobrevibacter sp.]|nr:M48 family metallopeptidase [Methanobrevibacter sp.]